MWAWGQKHWELWNNKSCKWYSRASLRRWLADPRGDVLLIAKTGGEPVGMCVAHTIRDLAYCTGLFIERGYRGNGVATKLVDHMITALQKEHVKEIMLSVNAKNVCARSLFRSMGFEKGYPSIPMIMSLGKKK
jgi:ribosomal protein S18 acetylase RimI-like enzyme